MSSPTWTRDALSSERRSWAGLAWRVVEAQHHVSLLKLTDTLAEQALLEDLVEATKPSVPPECRHLDFLLATPFRYGAPYPRGSRFRRAGSTPGVFYAALGPATAIAEMAFYRILFFAESPETPWPREPSELTAFAASVATEGLLDLTAPPLSDDAAVWTHPVDYAGCQALADAARDAGADVLRYRSVRDPAQGDNLAVLSCRAFARSTPVDRQTWRLRLSPMGVQALCEAPRARLEFPREVFAGDPRLAATDWQRGPGRAQARNPRDRPARSSSSDVQ